MSARTGTRASTRTEFYDLLQVNKDVTEQDLKRAYRKQALRLHPDRGGDPEMFKRMKYAYDILLDPKKRQVYDRYGEAAVKAMDGNMTPEAAMAIFFNIGVSERMILVAGLSVFTGYLLLFPVLLSVHWDHPNNLPFAVVFIPIWLALIAVAGCCLCVVRAPEFDPNEDDEEMRKQIEEMQRQTRNLRVQGVVAVIVLFVFLLFLVLRLDGHDHWSYFAVLWPWMLLDAVSMAQKLYSAEVLFIVHGGSPEVLSDGNRWCNSTWICFVLTLVRSHCFHFAFAILIAWKLDGVNMSWWMVFLPIWADWSLSIVANLMRCCSIKKPAELETMTEEQRANEATVGSIFCLSIFQMIGLGCVGLICGKLHDTHSYSAFVVFIPVFVAGGCFCCCLSCCVMTMAPPPPEEGGTNPAAQGSQPPQEYGSMEAGTAGVSFPTSDAAGQALSMPLAVNIVD